MLKTALFTAALVISLPALSLAAETLTGTPAAPDGRTRVSAAMVVAPKLDGALAVDLTMTAAGQQRPIARYEAELSMQLHLIAISSDFSTFVHEHAVKADAQGHLKTALRLPKPGRYHVYADATPAGLGQQVMRFELGAGAAPGAAPVAQPGPALAPALVPALEAGDGRYAVRFDPFVLHAGEEGELSLNLLRDGTLAPDVTPFLGVAAHAVFIAESDLSYVHVHATPATTKPRSETAAHKSMAMPGGDAMPVPLRAGAHVPANLTLHVLAPRAGAYRLWVQFMAGGQVRTFPFVVTVA